MTTIDELPVEQQGLATRSRGKLIALAAATILAIYLCYLLASPFIPALVWATTAAVVTQRYHGWVGRRVDSPNARAAICAGTVAAAILLPATFVVYVGSQQVAAAIENLQSEETQKSVQEWFDQHPRLNRMWHAVADDFNPAEKAPELIDRLRPGAVAAVSTPLYVALQVILTLYILFFLYRDQEQALGAVRWMLPLTSGESNRLLQRIDDTLHATILGTLTVAVLQGTLGGTMLWLLGVPGALLWGVVMAFVAMIPTGTFTVWGPAAVYLFLEDHWIKALILLGWGALAVGTIDNFLYPVLVGHRLRLHTVVTFIAIVGGLTIFGMTGIVLGPVIITVAFFLLDIWRRRTEHGESAERA